jgi:hypothetical protein
MQPITAFLASLLMTAIISFLLPLVVIGTLWLGLVGLTVAVPWISLGHQALAYLLQFLAILGSGSPWQGVVVIGIASGAVGILFDTFAFYRFQSFSHH